MSTYMRPKNVPIIMAPNVLSSAGNAPSAKEDAPVAVALFDILVPAASNERGEGPRKQVESVEHLRAPEIYIAALAASSHEGALLESRTSHLRNGNAPHQQHPPGALAGLITFHAFDADGCGPG